MTTRPVFKSSPQALSMSDPSSSPKVGRKKYPWQTLAIGESFLVAPNEANWNTISKSCYKWSKKLNKKFRAVDHGADGIEVARLFDSVGTIEPENKIVNFELDKT